jgi:hypothetical protein
MSYYIKKKSSILNGPASFTSHFIKEYKINNFPKMIQFAKKKSLAQFG